MGGFTVALARAQDWRERAGNGPARATALWGRNFRKRFRTSRHPPFEAGLKFGLWCVGFERGGTVDETDRKQGGCMGPDREARAASGARGARRFFGALCAGAVLCVASGGAIAEPCVVTMRFEHVFGDQPLRLNDVSYRTSGGNIVSVSRLSYLISHVKLIGADGFASASTEVVGFIDAEHDRLDFELGAVEAGNFVAIEFDVGLPPDINHSDPSRYGPADALNPVLNGLHWSWQGGYVFLAIEGRYVLPADALGGYSYHIATDRHLMKVRLGGPFTVERSGSISVQFDVQRVFDGEQAVTISRTRGFDSTHSGKDDLLAGMLASNIARAFSLKGVSAEVVTTKTPAVPIAPPAGTHRTALRIPEGFGEPPLPPDNPLTVEGVELGKKLFFEKKLSAGDVQSCADCHHPAAAFSDPGKVFSTGVDGLSGRRNTMPLFNLAWMTSMTWDGKRTRIRDQALAPIQDEREMHQPLGAAVAKLAAESGYQAAFERAFGSPGVDAERLGLALEQYLLTIVSGDSKFDRAMREEDRLTPLEQRGLDLFVLEFDPARGQLGADCFHCHGNELFTNNQFRNNGIDSSFADPGRQGVTGKSSDAGKFKVPSLRNVELTGPYMHDGRFATLEEVIDHYADGVRSSETLDPNISKHPDGGLALTCEDRRALVAFLKTLTDPKFRDSD